MKIYLDLELLLNFSYDLLLLLTVDLTLKRHSKIFRHIISAIIGSLSLIILFLPFNNYILFLFKILTSVIMLFISFGYKNFKYFATNFLYLYMCSVILGGFLYFLDLEFSYKREGLIFYFDGLSINYVLLLILAPIILFIYIKEHKKYKSTYSYTYRIELVFKNNKKLDCVGFLDTGNKLRDPITKKYVILVPKKLITSYINIRSPIYVSYRSLNKKGLVECFGIKYLKVNDQVFTNYMVGISDETFNLNGADCLLNYKLMEDICLEK